MAHDPGANTWQPGRESGAWGRLCAPMSRISRQEVDQIAELARLSLSEDEAAAMERDLERILD